MLRKAFVLRYARHAIRSALCSVPEPIRVKCALALAMTSPAVVRAVRAEVFAGAYLNHHRFGIRDVRSVVSEAIQRFPSGRIFLLSDGTAAVPGATQVECPAAASLINGDNVFVVAFQSDQQMIQALQGVLRLRGLTSGRVHWLTPRVYLPAAHYFHQNDAAYETLREEHALRHGKFDLLDFENLMQAAEVTRNIEGDYVEIGAYRGDSAHCMLNYMRRAGIHRRCWLLDTYEGFNYAEARFSGDKVWQGTHSDTSINQVRDFLAEYKGARCLKLNIISDGLPEDIAKIAVCNIDVDMYEAVLAAALKVANRMVVGGVVVLEDPGHTPFLAGARLALHEFMSAGEGRSFTPLYFESGQTFLIKLC